ncbi:hypothetical protein D3C78_1329930 [compost metagenome]
MHKQVRSHACTNSRSILQKLRNRIFGREIPCSRIRKAAEHIARQVYNCPGCNLDIVRRVLFQIHTRINDDRRARCPQRIDMTIIPHPHIQHRRAFALLVQPDVAIAKAHSFTKSYNQITGNRNTRVLGIDRNEAWCCQVLRPKPPLALPDTRERCAR